MLLKPISSEKAVKLLELDNTMVFATERRAKKDEIKKYIEDMFSVKVESVRTFIRNNEKYAYVRFNKNNLAVDLAAKLGMI